MNLLRMLLLLRLFELLSPSEKYDSRHKMVPTSTVIIRKYIDWKVLYILCYYVRFL